MRICVSGQLAQPLWHAEPRPLRKKPGPSAAAVGATRGVVVMLLPRVLIIVALGEFGQRFEQVRNLYRAGCIGRPVALSLSQQQLVFRRQSLRSGLDQS